MKIHYNEKNSILVYSNGVCYYGISDDKKTDNVYSYKFGEKPVLYTSLFRRSAIKFWMIFQVWSDGTVIHITDSDFSRRSNTAGTIVYQATTPSQNIDIPRQYGLGDMLLWNLAKSPYSDQVAFRNRNSQAVIMHWPSLKTIDITPKELGKMQGVHWIDAAHALLINRENCIYEYNNHRFSKMKELDPKLSIVDIVPSGQGAIVWNFDEDTTEYHDIKTNRTMQVYSRQITNMAYAHKGSRVLLNLAAYTDIAYILDLSKMKITERKILPNLWNIASDANINKQFDFMPCILWDGKSTTAEISKIYI